MSTFTQLPADYALEFVAGDYVAIPMTIRSADVPKDLTGYTFDAHIRTGNATTVAFTIQVLNQLSSPGQFILSLSMAQTIALQGSYTWELDWLDVALNRRSLISSSVLVVKNG